MATRATVGPVAALWSGRRLLWSAKTSAWINTGGSVIVDPDGKVLAGPAFETETILYADIRRDQLVGPRWQLDIAGHYARPDVFELIVHRRPRPIIQERDGPSSSDTGQKEKAGA